MPFIRHVFPAGLDRGAIIARRLSVTRYTAIVFSPEVCALFCDVSFKNFDKFSAKDFWYLSLLLMRQFSWRNENVFKTDPTPSVGLVTNLWGFGIITSNLAKVQFETHNIPRVYLEKSMGTCSECSSVDIKNTLWILEICFQNYYLKQNMNFHWIESPNINDYPTL